MRSSGNNRITLDRLRATGRAPRPRMASVAGLVFGRCSPCHAGRRGARDCVGGQPSLERHRRDQRLRVLAPSSWHIFTRRRARSWVCREMDSVAPADWIHRRPTGVGGRADRLHRLQRLQPGARRPDDPRAFPFHFGPFAECHGRLRGAGDTAGDLAATVGRDPRQSARVRLFDDCRAHRLYQSPRPSLPHILAGRKGSERFQGTAFLAAFFCGCNIPALLVDLRVRLLSLACLVTSVSRHPSGGPTSALSSGALG